MIRLVAVAVISLVANAVALLVAAVVLDDMSLSFGGFVLEVAIFTGISVLVEPLLRQSALRSAPALLGSTALVSTLVSLFVTALLTDGLRIDGLLTWVFATVVVWGVALIARFLLPLVIFKRTMARVRND